MSTLPALLQSLLPAVVSASLSAAAMVLVIQSLVWLTRSRLTPRWTHALWLLVFVRLVIVVLPEVPRGITPPKPTPADVSQYLGMSPPELSSTGLMSPLLMDDAPAFQSPLPHSSLPEVPPSSDSITDQASPWSWLELLSTLWFSVALALISGMTFAAWITLRRLRHRSIPAPQRETDLFLKLCSDLQLPRPPELCVCPDVKAPLVVGLWRPHILLPLRVVEHFTTEQKRHVLAHELAHLQRRDLWLHAAIAVLQAVHWFNPFVWFASARLRAAAERCCDEWVLRRLSLPDGRAYADTLLCVLESHRRSRTLPGIAAMAESRTDLRRRILAMGHRPVITRGWLIASACLLTLLTFFSLTSPGAEKSPSQPLTPPSLPDPSPALPPPSSSSVSTASNPSSPSTPVSDSDTIGGMVVDESGRPVADAEIQIGVRRTRDKFKQSVLPSDYKNPAKVKTDAKGHWQILGVPVGVVPETSQANGEGRDTYRFSIKHPDFLFTEFSSMTLFYGTDREFRQSLATLVLPRGHALEGMVKDEKGQPIVGATIERRLGRRTREVTRAVTDAQGHYQMKAAAPGDLATKVIAKGFATLLLPLNVSANTTQDFTLKTAKTLTLTLRDENDQPITRAYVAILPTAEGLDNSGSWYGDQLWSSSEPDEHGTILWQDAPGGPLLANISAFGFKDTQRTVTAGSEMIIKLPGDLRLPQITLKVVDAETQTPLSDCTILSGTVSPDTSPPLSSRISWRDKDVAIPFKAGTSPGIYTGTSRSDFRENKVVFSVRHEGYAPTVTAPLDPKALRGPIEISLAKREPFTFTAVTPSGTPAAKAGVYVSWLNSSMQVKEHSVDRSEYLNRNLEFAGETDANGRCTLPACADDAAVLVMHTGGFASAAYGDLVRAPSLALGSYGSVEAHVTRNGKPAPNVLFEYQGAMTLPGNRYVMMVFNITSDAGGHITLPRVFPAQQAHFAEVTTIVAEGRGRTVVSPSEYKTVSAGQTTTFNLEAKASTLLPATGRFLVQGSAAASKPQLSGMPVWLMHTTGNGGTAATTHADGEGRFKIPSIPPGDYLLVLPRQGDKPSRYTLTMGRTSWPVKIPQAALGEKAKPHDLGTIDLVDMETAPDLTAPKGKAAYRLRVQDSEGKPIPAAKVTFISARLEAQRGAAYNLGILGQSDTPVPVSANQEGIADPTTPAVSVDGSKVYAMQTRVEAEGYVPEYALDSNVNRETVVKLTRAAKLSVQLLRDGQPVQDGQASFRCSTDFLSMTWDEVHKHYTNASLKPSPSKLQVSYHAKDGTRLFSPVLSAELKPGQETHLTADLHAGIRVAGRVDAQVPRPVRDGRIAVYVVPSTADGDRDSFLYWSDWQTLKEDGSFDFPSLPQGHMSFVVMAEGWTSPFTSESLYNKPWPAGEITESRSDVTIPMLPTASCEIMVVNGKGLPVKGATVALSPNFSPRGIGNQIIAVGYEKLGENALSPAPKVWANIETLWQRYRTTTNAEGRAILHNLPALRNEERVLVYGPNDNPMQKSTFPSDQSRISLRPGETAKATITLEPPVGSSQR